MAFELSTVNNPNHIPGNHAIPLTPSEKRIDFIIKISMGVFFVSIAGGIMGVVLHNYAQKRILKIGAECIMVACVVSCLISFLVFESTSKWMNERPELVERLGYPSRHPTPFFIPVSTV